jgi:hypothetical protein
MSATTVFITFVNVAHGFRLFKKHLGFDTRRHRSERRNFSWGELTKHLGHCSVPMLELV